LKSGFGKFRFENLEVLQSCINRWEIGLV
jgi:hypothetical protein